MKWTQVKGVLLEVSLCYSKLSLVSISLKVKVKVLLMASKFLILSIHLSSILLMFYFSSLPTLCFCQTSLLLIPLKNKKWGTTWLVYFLFVLLGILFPPPWTRSGFTQNAFQEHFYQYFPALFFTHNFHENPIHYALYWFCVCVCVSTNSLLYPFIKEGLSSYFVHAVHLKHAGTGTQVLNISFLNGFLCP